MTNTTYKADAVRFRWWFSASQKRRDSAFREYDLMWMLDDWRRAIDEEMKRCV